ncbi:MAG: M48 family metalloprotease [Desulfovibrio sp.]|nr:M48 family metalloprotease [Desulfovibrio sp.]
MTFRGPLTRRLAAFAFLCLFLAAQLWALTAQAFYWGGVTIKDEKQMGRKFDLMIRSHLSIIEDPEVSLYVKDVLARLVKSVPPQPYEFKSAVILNNGLNAFAVPGGYVYVLTGLIMNLDREDELAGVLSHELAHVTLRHVAARLERAQYLTVGSLLLAVAGIAIAGPAGGAVAVGALGASQSAMLNYSRVDENEADHIGLQYLTAAKYSPSGLVGGFKVLRQKSWMSGVSIPTYLSTHPDLGDRINGLQARIATMPAAVRDRRQNNSRFIRVKTLLWARYGDTQAALQRFSGKDGLSAMGRGIVRARTNDVTGASRAFDEALAASPNDPLILREAGIFHYRKGDMARASGLLTRAMKLDPRDYMASFFYARYLDESGSQAQAHRYYDEVLRYVPEESEVHEAYARSLGRSGRTFEAYVHMTYSAMYAHDKKQSERHFERAKALARTDNDRRLLKRLETDYKERKEMWEQK